MAGSSMELESKIMDLQARLHAENEASNSVPVDLSNAFASPSHAPHRPRHFDLGTPTRSRKLAGLNLPFILPKTQDTSKAEVENKMKEIMKMSGILNINGKKYQTEISDLEHLGELGNGTCGHVVKMLHKPSQMIIAVKQMRRSGNSEENKRITMDLEVVLKSHGCRYIVCCLGCFITDADVWICMELMSTCFDKLLRRYRRPVPELILGKVTLATVKALHYLKESHGVIHRDVKPSNILIDEKGNVKLCDFGISGRLVDSKAKTKNAGCAAYMAPERIDPPDPRKPDYDIRADVWSLGITLVELATGVFPYRDCKSDFEVLSRILNDEPPSLPQSRHSFSPEFNSFVKSCLTKDCNQRPKYRKLLDHAFLRCYETKEVDVAAWLRQLEQSEANSDVPTMTLTPRLTPPPASPIPPRRHPPPPPPASYNHRHKHHHRSLSETVIANGDADGSGSNNNERFSPFRQCDPPPLALRFSHTPPPQPQPPEWDRNRQIGACVGSGGVTGSPVAGRKRYPSVDAGGLSSLLNHPSQDPVTGNTSPLMLQRFYHQQSQHHNSYPVTYRSTSVSPCRQYTSESAVLGGVEGGGGGGGSKKRFASHIKIIDLGRRAPSPSPEPPPRLNRVASPLLLRRHLPPSGEPSPLPQRRPFDSPLSPSLSRRYVSPSPPQPPPRRLSESNSVPASPQHPGRRLTRYQYTPEPQRRFWHRAADLTHTDL